MSTDLRFVRFDETSEHEGETWTFWLQVNGNEDQLDKLQGILASEADEDEDFAYDLSSHSEETLPEEHVDVLVKHAAGDGYRDAHTKVVGRLVCPDSLGDGADDLCKGKITKLFTVEVRGA